MGIDVGSEIYTINNPEFISVVIDKKSRILCYIKKDGTDGSVSIDENRANIKTVRSGAFNPSKFSNTNQFTPICDSTKPLIYKIEGQYKGCVSYPDGTLFYARDNKIYRVSTNGVETSLLTIDGANGFRCIWLDSSLNLFVSPSFADSTNASKAGLYKLKFKEDSFYKVLSLYNPSSTISTEKEENNDTIWTMTEDREGILYAGVYALTHINPSIYRSDDGGESWKHVIDMTSVIPTGRHIHVIAYNKYDDSLYCIVGEQNFIWRSTDKAEHWENIGVTLENAKGTSMIIVNDGLIIGSDDAYWGEIHKVYGDLSNKVVAKWWANVVFAIRQSDITGWLYAAAPIDSSVQYTQFYPPVEALTDTSVLKAWKDSNPVNLSRWLEYHDSMIGRYDEDSIRPTHTAILISRDNGESWEILVRLAKEEGEINEMGFFRNGECTLCIGNNTLIISEGNHSYTENGIDISNRMLKKINKSNIVNSYI